MKRTVLFTRAKRAATRAGYSTNIHPLEEKAYAARVFGWLAGYAAARQDVRRAAKRERRGKK